MPERGSYDAKLTCTLERPCDPGGLVIPLPLVVAERCPSERTGPLPQPVRRLPSPDDFGGGGTGFPTRPFSGTASELVLPTGSLLAGVSPEGAEPASTAVPEELDEAGATPPPSEEAPAQPDRELPQSTGSAATENQDTPVPEEDSPPDGPLAPPQTLDPAAQPESSPGKPPADEEPACPQGDDAKSLSQDLPSPASGRGAGGEGGHDPRESARSMATTTSPHPDPLPKGSGCPT